jgi:hypothetical protein
MMTMLPRRMIGDAVRLNAMMMATTTVRGMIDDATAAKNEIVTGHEATI